LRTTIQISDDLRKELKILCSRRDIPYEDMLNDMVRVFKELDRNKTIISIPTDVAERVKKLSRDSGFGSSSEFITYLLRDLLGSMSEKKKDEEKFSDSDNKRLRQRLAALGYLS